MIDGSRLKYPRARHALCLGSMLSCATLFASPGVTLAQQPPAVPVGTVIAEKRAITQTADFVGRIEAVNRVDVRARVTGYLEDVLFKDGATVAEGTPLFRIERAPFEAAVEQAQGALERAQGTLQNATIQRQRAEDLLRTNAGSVAIRDQRVAEEKGAQGDETTAAANLKTARINLGYTEIKAPIAGRIGRTRVTKGNVVGPDSGVLAQIVSDDPMYVTFPVSQREFLALKTNRLPAEGQAPLVSLKFSDGSTYDQKGRVDFVDVSVERATDTVLVRATLPNPDGKLLDGTLVRVGVQAPQSEEKVLVPQSALIADQQGAYVFAVEDGKAVVKRVKVGAEAGAYVAIDEGLAGKEQIVIQGLQNLRPGVPVLASPVTLTTGRS
jgi:membrane fusion protein, multidrug efflux system